MTHDTDIPQGYKATALGVIPQKWEVKFLGDLLSRCTNGLTYDVSITCGIPVTRIETISTGEINYAKVGYIPNESGYETFRMQKGDILYSHINSLSQIGKVAYYKGDKEIYHGMNLLLLRANNCLDKQYLYYTLLTEHMRHMAQIIAKPAVNQASISTSDLKRVKIAVPPLAEQRKIAEVLGVWDEAIEKQARLIEKLALRKRGLMQRLLSAKLRLPGFSEPWQKVNYSDILKEVRRTLTWDENELYDLISVRRRSGGVFHRESLYGHEIKTKTLRPALEGDFLISKMQIVHGASGVVPKQLSGMKISGSYIALIAKDPKELNINYFNLWSQMPLFYHQTFVSSYGVHIEKMTFDLDAFMSLSMNLPPIEEQNRIVEVISTATNEIELAKEKLERLRRQKRGLMQQLLTGKKRIKY